MAVQVVKKSQSTKNFDGILTGYSGYEGISDYQQGEQDIGDAVWFRLEKKLTLKLKENTEAFVKFLGQA